MPGDLSVPLQSRFCRACWCQTIHWKAAKLELEQNPACFHGSDRDKPHICLSTSSLKAWETQEIKIWSCRDGWCCQSYTQLTGKGSLLTDPCTRDVPLKKKGFKLCYPQVPGLGFVFLSAQTAGEGRPEQAPDDSCNPGPAIEHCLKHQALLPLDFLSFQHETSASSEQCLQNPLPCRSAETWL